MVMSVGFRPFETYKHALMDMNKCITSLAYAQGCQICNTFMLLLTKGYPLKLYSSAGNYPVRLNSIKPSNLIKKA
jgi:hypothetical protein